MVGVHPLHSLLAFRRQSELVPLYKVDAAFGEVMASADGQLRSWRNTVGAGKVIPDFGAKVRFSLPPPLKGWLFDHRLGGGGGGCRCRRP